MAGNSSTQYLYGALNTSNQAVSDEINPLSHETKGKSMGRTSSFCNVISRVESASSTILSGEGNFDEAEKSEAINPTGATILRVCPLSGLLSQHFVSSSPYEYPSFKYTSLFGC